MNLNSQPSNILGASSPTLRVSIDGAATQAIRGALNSDVGCASVGEQRQQPRMTFGDATHALREAQRPQAEAEWPAVPTDDMMEAARSAIDSARMDDHIMAIYRAMRDAHAAQRPPEQAQAVPPDARAQPDPAQQTMPNFVSAYKSAPHVQQVAAALTSRQVPPISDEMVREVAQAIWKSKAEVAHAVLRAFVAARDAQWSKT